MNKRKLKSVTFVFFGLMLINICANYVSGSTGVYAATAFREYGRIDLLSIMFVIEPLTRSVSLFISGSAGEYLGRKSLYLWSVGAYAISIFGCAFSPNGSVPHCSGGLRVLLGTVFYQCVFHSK